VNVCDEHQNLATLGNRLGFQKLVFIHRVAQHPAGFEVGALHEIIHQPPGNVSKAQRVMQIRANLLKTIPQVDDYVPAHERVVSIIGGGPSLDVSEIDFTSDVWALNGTLNYLIKHEMRPDAFVMLDARDSNTRFLDSGLDITYYIASQCHPLAFVALRDNKVIMWNARETEFESSEWPDCMWIGGGSTVGTRAIFLAYVLGYRTFHLHGFDSSYAPNGAHHAYAQEPGNDRIETVWYRGSEYTLEPWMMSQAQDLIRQVMVLQPLECKFQVFGSGLLPDMYRQCHLSDEDRERRKYVHAWMQEPYRRVNHGLTLWRNHRELFPDKIESAIDLGCGLGGLFSQWNDEGINGWGLDLAPNCLDADVARKYSHKFLVDNLWDFDLDEEFDVAVCADVMEHIPENRVDAVLKNIHKHSKQAFFKIANYPHIFEGFQLHMTMHPVEWWLEKMPGAEQIPYDTDKDEFIIKW